MRRSYLPHLLKKTPGTLPNGLINRSRAADEIFEKKTYRFTKKNRFEQKIPGRHKTRPIFLISIIPGHLNVAKRASEYIL